MLYLVLVGTEFENQARMQGNTKHEYVLLEMQGNELKNITKSFERFKNRFYFEITQNCTLKISNNSNLPSTAYRLAELIGCENCFKVIF